MTRSSYNRSTLWLLVVAWISASVAWGASGSTDCNSNGIPDELEIDVSFAQRALPGTVSNARKIVAADLDGDGDLDAVSVSAGDDTVGWNENTDGLGTFGSRQAISSTLVGARSIAVVDVDGDGDLDVVAGGVDLLGWFENTNGQAAFGSLQTILSATFNPTSVTDADLDGDGDRDLVFTDLDGDSVDWVENLDGQGTFSPPRGLPDLFDGPITVAADDLDGDLDDDVVVASRFDGQVAWLENANGDASLFTHHPVDAAAAGATGLRVVDVDGDLDPDLLATHEVGDMVAWYENTDGAGTFGPPQVVTAGLDGPRSAFASDLDGDGDRDVVVASFFDDFVTWYENLDGLGTFGAGEFLSFFSNGATWVHAADLTGDGAPDVLAAAELEAQLTWFENESNDCNDNAVPDDCDIDAGTEQDCNANGAPDDCEIDSGLAADCNGNGTLDSCDLASGTSLDCSGNGVPDECEPDCNTNSTPDDCDIDAGTSDDCNANGTPDECEPDCNANSIPDTCDVDAGTSPDCNGNGTPDECEVDCNGNSIPDDCDVDTGVEDDCDANGVPDVCDVAGGGVDCNTNGVPDACDIAGGLEQDCDASGIPDACEIAAGAADCDGNGRPDACDIAVAFSETLLADDIGGGNAIVAEDLDGDGDLDLLAISLDTPFDSFPDSLDWLENLDGAGTFSSRIAISHPIEEPRSVATGDLDGDGDPDLLAGFNSGIQWYENRLDVDGSFGASFFIEATFGMHSVVAADVDGDGDLDAVGASGGTGILWWENLDGAGDFGAGNEIDNTSQSAIAVSDLDGDGDLDVVGTGTFGMGWYENLDGSGSFSDEQTIAPSGSPGSVFAGDLDGDADPDVAWTIGSADTVIWSRNEGGGEFATPVPVSTVADGANSVTGADVDGDGDLDLVATSAFDGTIGWFENLDGLGSFGARIAVGTTDGGPRMVDAADLDGDGGVDLAVVAWVPGKILWYRNLSDDCDADGTPDSCELPAGDCDANGILDTCDALLGSGTDCNGNELLDECDIDGGTSIDCTLNGVPDECEPDCNGNGVADSCDVDAGTSDDCDLDGIPDECEEDCNGNGQNDDCEIASGLAADCNANLVPDECDIDSGTSLDTCPNGVPDECEPDCNGNGKRDSCDIAFGDSPDCNANDVPDECELIEDFERQSIDEPGSVRATQPADIDGDGDQDVLVGRSGAPKLIWYPNDGSGSFGSEVVISASSAVIRIVATVDLDGDGDLDVMAVRTTSGTINWNENVDGAGTFGPDRLVGDGLAFVVSVEAADVDGDGDADVVVASSPDDTVAWYENLDGLGSFGPARIISDVASSVESIDVVDLDGDGDLDVVAAETGDDTVIWFENADGLGTFASEQLVGLDDGPLRVVAVDLDGDHDVDVLVGASAGNVIWHEKVGAGFAVHALYEMPFAIADLTAADLDGDGDLDVALLNSAGLFQFEQLEDGSFGGAVELLDATGLHTVEAGDLDSDGVTDLLCANQVPGEVFWMRNEKDDCTDDGILDECEPDCNANGRADSCDLLVATSLDCDSNGSPDECDTACTSGCDADGDACLDDVDTSPGNPLQCADTDGDGCDDCASGVFDPAADGTDGVCDPGDCDPADGSVWQPPTAVSTLRLGESNARLDWSPPAAPGSSAPRYDTLRSGTATDFVTLGVCVETDGSDTETADALIPPPGQVLYYLVRIENACPGAPGALGTDSSGQPRPAASCPP